jgi:hypothetical protein
LKKKRFHQLMLHALGSFCVASSKTMAVPQKHTWVTTERLDKFLSTTYWTDCNLKAAEDVLTKSLPPGTALSARVLSLPQTSTDEVFPTRMAFSEAVDAFKVPHSRATINNAQGWR